jgi:uncharacterized secreted protein with C-terminal beta-propeller domain
MKKIFAFAILAIAILLGAQTVLAQATSLASDTLQAQTFTDVPSLNVNSDAIGYLETNNIIQGYSDSTFKPDNRINRAEFVKIVVGTLVKNPTGSDCFTDVNKEWFAKYICTAKRLGYIQGYGDGSFKPSDYINFAEASKIITTAMKVKPDTTGTKHEWFAGFVNGLAKKNAIPPSVQFFDKDVSRGEIAETIWRLKTGKTDKVSQTYEGLTSLFPSVQTCVGLKEKFDEYRGQQVYPLYRGGVMMENAPVPTAAPMTNGTAAPVPAAAPASGAGSASYSQTNLQVAGVDEADVIKNDGQYIYMVKGDTVRIFDAYPPKNLEQVSEVKFDKAGFTPQEMYVDGDRLVVVGQVYQNFYYPMPMAGVNSAIIMPPRPFQGPNTLVYQFDISDRKNPKQTRVLAFDGNYFTSRRIGNRMVMVMNDTPDYWLMDKVDTGEQLVPNFQDGDKAEEPMVKCGDIHYFPGYAQPNYLIVASIPLDNATGDVSREVMLGSSDNVYSSVNNIYVATNETNYDQITDWDWHTDHTNTLVFKFGLDDTGVSFKSRGSVPGRIINQFSMDENGDTFRLATTIDSSNPDTPTSNNVYVMDKDMKITGSITGIAPDEKIYSTRFMGDRLYMVTFKSVDPLFVIGLEDPKDPKILGKLKIPGFSDYLEPYDKTHIIGFGKDVDESIDANLVHSPGSVYYTAVKGFKMALFDVSDVANPVQMFSEGIGDQGTTSEILDNHKALLFDKDKSLLAFPITIVEKITSDQLDCTKYRYSTCLGLCEKRCIPSTCTVDSTGHSNCTSDCEGPGSCVAPQSEQYSTTFSGAVVYTLNLTDGFKLRGRVTHYSDADIQKMGNYWPYQYDLSIQRALYMGDVLYTVSQGMLKANDINSIKELNSLKID